MTPHDPTQAEKIEQQNRTISRNDPNLKVMQSLDANLATPEEIKAAFIGLQKIATGGAFDQRLEEDRFTQIMNRMDQLNNRMQAWEDNPEKYVSDVMEQGNRRIGVGEVEREEIRAREASRLQATVAQKRAEAKGMKAKLAEEPQEKIAWPTKVVMSSNQGVPQAVQVPEVVIIGTATYCFAAGSIVEVPISVADILRQRVAGIQEKSVRTNILRADKLKSTQEVAKQWSQANHDHKSATDGMQYYPEG